jgi:hypothetical protein
VRPAVSDSKRGHVDFMLAASFSSFDKSLLCTSYVERNSAPLVIIRREK